MYSINELEDHLVGMGHGSSLAKIRNKYALYERAGNNMRSKTDIVTTIRTAILPQVVHDDQFQYAVPADYSKIIDLYPARERTSSDFARRTSGVTASLLRQLRDKQIAVESRDGARILVIDWAGNTPKTISKMNTTTDWTAVGTATGIELDTQYAMTGGKSVKFDVVASGDGLANTALEVFDLSETEEENDFLMWVYIGDITNLNSFTARWGNDLTANYFQSTAQTTQADGTAFQNGWNLIKFPWVSATENGSVNTATMDSFRVVLDTDGAISDVRFDNIVASVGSPFEIKYYSAYLFRNTAGTWIRQPSFDTDNIMLDELSFNIFAYECLIAMAQQMEGEDSGFDIQFAITALNGNPSSADPALRMGLYARYRNEYPSMTKRTVQTYYNTRRSRF
jgi:hypothetical protein